MYIGDNMEYVILTLIIIVLILLVVLLLRKNNNTDMQEKISKLELNLVKELGDFKSDFAHSLTDDFNNQTERLDNRLRLINDKFNVRDAEVLIAGNSIDSIKKALIKRLHNNCNITVINCKRIVEIIFN